MRAVVLLGSWTTVFGHDVLTFRLSRAQNGIGWEAPSGYQHRALR